MIIAVVAVGIVVKVTPPLVCLYALLMDSWQLTNLQSKSLSCSLLAKKVIK